jgi:hypothetical protein
VAEALDAAGPPAAVTAVGGADARAALRALGPAVQAAADAAALPDEAFDDVIYFGADPGAIETLNDKLAGGGVLCVVLGGEAIGRPVSLSLGRAHYGRIRWIGTRGASPADAYAAAPADGEIADGDRILIVGAAGPMGQMHVLRNVCSGADGLRIVATDFDQQRLDVLAGKAGPLAAAHGVALECLNPNAQAPEGPFDYVAIMAPVPELVDQALAACAPGGRVNLFAGIPASVRHPIDLEACIDRRCHLIGTSGSTIEDMKIVLGKLQAGRLDTNFSVDAVSGMAGAADGMAAVEHRTLAGKIVVYPQLHDLPLVPLAEMPERLPSVAARLDRGVWTKAAEDELLRSAT